MGTEKSIFGKGLNYIMADEDKPSYYLPKKEETPSSAYANFLKRTKTGKPSFDSYLDAVLIRKQNPQTEDNSRIDEFLRREVDMSYEDFVNCAKPEEIEENSYGLFKRTSIKRSLFKLKSKAYLEALCDFEEQGGDIQAVLNDIREEYIPTLKKERGREPTFEAIYSVLKKS